MNKDLFKRYFDNSCTSEERAQVLQWLQDPGHREEVLAILETEWSDWKPDGGGLAMAAKEMDLPFERLMRKAGGHRNLAGGRVRWLRVVSAVAASLLFLLAGTYIGYRYKGQSAAPGVKAPVYYATAQTLRGQRTKVLLGDGSEIFLNAESRLSFSNESTNRQVVYLEGEAFFKVPEKERPLIVKTKDVIASARGSQFNISAFPKDSVVTVSVQHGKAEVSANNEKIFPMLALRIPARDSVGAGRGDSGENKAADKAMPKVMPLMTIRPVTVHANESVTFDKTNKRTTQPTKLTDEELQLWKDGFMYFNRTDSAGLVDKLQRWFDVEVILDTDGAPLRTLNCGFKNPTLTEVLNHISKELNLEYKIEGKKVFLNRRHS